MGLLKWIKRELDSSNSCKRRQSEPPLPGNSSQLPRDESYVKALSKFNEWRTKQKFGGTHRLSRKQSKKLIANRGQSDTFFENRNRWNNQESLSNNVTTIDNSLYEEIQLNQFETPRSNLSSSTVGRTLEVIPIRHSAPTTNITNALIHRNSSVRQPNELYANISNFDQSPDILNTTALILSPPIRFFRKNSNPFANVITPNRDKNSEDASERIYEIPHDTESLDILRANFKLLEAPSEDIRQSTSSGKSNRFPPYQTVINKHGDEVEYALPLNEKLDDGVNYSAEAPTGETSGVAVMNDTSKYQQYIEKNFEFLDEKEQLGISGMSESFNRNQFHRKNVPVTDLDKTNGTKVTDDQNHSKSHNIIQELESLETWSKSIEDNLETSIHKRVAIDMHFAEIIVCNTQDVTENDPREILETLNGAFHAGTFHCVPVTQFKPHRKENICGDSILQMNYEILRKIRHPDITLLMGITVDNKCAMDSLILEPLDYSLNHFIHTEATCIPLPVCLLYTLQITNAVTYLHKHGLIHSNISSHTIVMCNLSKAVKLTSFELTTTQDSDLRDELMDVFQNNNQCIEEISQVPYKLRPYSSNYRKAFTKHNYQAPELLSKGFPFVFPKIQSDVYGICLTLWEMINCCTPYEEVTYDDMLQLIQLKNANLPTILAERQKPFDSTLEVCLHAEVGKRLSDTIKLTEVLKDLSLYFEDRARESNTEEKLLSIKERDEIPDLLSPKIFHPMIYERSSTMKKRHNLLANNHLSVRQLFAYSHISKSNAMIPSHTSSPNSPKCGFEIGDVSIPETPIARSNKLRKTAWLTNQSISPIVHLEIKSKDDDTSINQIQIVEKKLPTVDSMEDTCGGKAYNVNIRIRPKPKTPNKSTDNSTSANENCSFSQVNKNTSHISDHIKFFNSVSQLKTQQAHVGKTASPVENHVNYNKNTTKPDLKIEKKLDQHLEPAITQKNINEFYSRNQSSADFENSLWRREKQKCDQSVKSPRRMSVKDAVNKFESFSKSGLSDSNSPKARRTPVSCTSSTDENKMHSMSSQLDSHEESESRRSVSKLNVVLQSKDNKNEQIAKEIRKEAEQDNKHQESCNISREQSPMLTLNFKKLDRRASDLSSYYIRRCPKNKTLTARHSIYGTDILKRLRKAQPTIEGDGDDVKDDNNSSIFEDRRKDFKIKVGKLTCLNCGHKLFVVDDVVSSNKGEDANEACTELLLTPLGRNSGLHATKSIEDFYIDDDFCEDIELCANMELGTGSQRSDLIDFDIFSAEIFNPTDERSRLLT